MPSPRLLLPVAAAMLAGCFSDPPEVYLIPAGYVGPVVIAYEQADGIPMAAFVDARGLAATGEGAWLNAPLVARPLGYGAQRASWPVVLDGLVVVREMQPSTPYVP